ncbi:DUF222 domain-containing protein [Microbacterium sp. NPDC087665]|uniref:HNH endonuclease signature motif containing protein n=1 Tax=Microbacterium sp. NPDC087665 TaxID=3364194 RepID=UPI0037F596F0
MKNAADVLDRVVADLDLLLRVDGASVGFAGVSDAEAMRVLRVAGEVQRRVDAVIVETVASVDSRPAGPGEVTFAAGFGCRTTNDLLQRILRTDTAGAARIVKAAKIVHRDVEFTTGAPLPARWPALREAMLGGAIGVAGLLAATTPIEQAGPRVGAADRWAADAELAGYARGLAAVDAADADAPEAREGDAAPPATPEDLRFLAQAIVAYLDPDGAEPAHERAMRARGITLGRAKDGVIPIRGALLPEAAGQLQRILDAYLNPKVDGPPLPGVRFMPSDGHGEGHRGAVGDGDALDAYGHVVGDAVDAHSHAVDDALDESVSASRADHALLPSGDPGQMIDTRTRPQKQHDALAAALAIAARHDDTPRLGGAAPTLIVSVTAEDYATGRGWAHVDGIDTPVSIATSRHTACGGSIQRVLFDPEGRIIGIGTSDRIFTTPQRRAIALRDQECLIPGCHVPAAWCEIHHVEEHARGGPTSTDNGVALCWHHHRTLDTSGWEIRMQNGTPQVRGPAWWDPHRRWRQPRPARQSGSRERVRVVSRT